MHRVTTTRAEWHPRRTKPPSEVPRPIFRARTPRQHCRACRVALFPLPFLPEMKVTFGPKSTVKFW